MLTPVPLLAQQADVTNLSAADANRTAEALLSALQQREGSIVYNQLADAVQRSLTMPQVQQRLNARPTIIESRVIGIASGHRTTTIDAVVTTSQGTENLLFVLDNAGQLLAWKWIDEVLPIERTALDFAADLAAGRWLQARSKLSLDLQQDLAPADLQRKWNKLSAVSGGFRKLKQAVIASQGGDQQLVLVSVEFGDATSNLFVIFDARGQIINVDISRDFV